MAYGTITAPAEGAVLPVDTIGGTDFPRTKISFGAEGSVTDVNSGAPLPVSITGSAAVTGTFWQATQPVSIAGTVAVSGPLTDTQLRAVAVPVSGTVGISGSVAVTGTFFQATQPVSIANPVAVTGTFWQATQPISAASLPLPTGASTAANQATIITHVDGVEASLSSMVGALVGTEYETVAASQTTQALGATGATGDLLTGVLIIPATTSPGAVSIKDGAGTAITVFAGGTDSVSTLHPFFVPLGIRSGAGAWQVTTGANVSAIGVGNFT